MRPSGRSTMWIVAASSTQRPSRPMPQRRSTVARRRIATIATIAAPRARAQGRSLISCRLPLLCFLCNIHHDQLVALGGPVLEPGLERAAELLGGVHRLVELAVH